MKLLDRKLAKEFLISSITKHPYWTCFAVGLLTITYACGFLEDKEIIREKPGKLEAKTNSESSTFLQSTNYVMPKNQAY